MSNCFRRTGRAARNKGREYQIASRACEINHIARLFSLGISDDLTTDAIMARRCAGLHLGGGSWMAGRKPGMEQGASA
jgi:hypothetical protein